MVGVALQNQSEKVQALQGVALFQGLPKKDLRAIARACDEESFVAGSVITKEDTHGERMLLILDGRVKVTKKGKRIAALGPRDVVGELSLIDGERRSATVTAETDVTTLVVYRSKFVKLVEEVPSLPIKLMTALSQRLRTADNELARRN